MSYMINTHIFNKDEIFRSMDFYQEAENLQFIATPYGELVVFGTRRFRRETEDKGKRNRYTKVAGLCLGEIVPVGKGVYLVEEVPKDKIPEITEIVKAQGYASPPYFWKRGIGSTQVYGAEVRETDPARKSRTTKILLEQGKIEGWNPYLDGIVLEVGVSNDGRHAVTEFTQEEFRSFMGKIGVRDKGKLEGKVVEEYIRGGRIGTLLGISPTLNNLKYHAPASL